MDKQQYFIDIHCHLFTAADIPLYQLAKRLHRKAQHPLRLFMAPAAIALLSVKKFREFIQFFESEPKQNVLRVTGQLKDSLEQLGVEAERVIMTPLIMDFDAGGKVDKLLPQVERLVAASKYAEGVTILPFVGIDPRRLLTTGPMASAGSDGDQRAVSPATVRKRWKEFLDVNLVKGIGARGGWGQLGKKIRSGHLVGVKLYPPLGFDVLPQQDLRLRDCHLEIYRELAHRKLPVTVHCQENSFELASSHQVAMDFTKPGNWRQVLEFSSQLSQLRLNFGHFGGDIGTKMVVPMRNRGEMEDFEDWVAPKKPRAKGWTYEIVAMLKQYPNTYADISAFAFQDKVAAAALMWLLAFDENGFFDQDGASNYKLQDKLMWGSDYPMILPNFPNYHSYLRAFRQTIRQNQRRFASFEMPPQWREPDAVRVGGPSPSGQSEVALGVRNHAAGRRRKGRNKQSWQPLPSAAELFQKLTCENPRRFLFE